jgi:hypothetical protein
MPLQRRNLHLATVFSSVTLAGAVAFSTLAQSPAPSAGTAESRTRGTTSIPALVPDLTGGIWAHPMTGFESPVTGPGPVVNKARLPNGVSNQALMVGDYTNPILKPNAAEILKKRGEISLSGLAFPDPDNQCRLEPVPYVFWNFEIQILQQPDKVTILYNHDHEFREVRMNQPHPAKVIPSVHGDSVGHYEGDTLVVDTVGVKVGPYTMIDRFGTPFTEALHVVERYHLIDYEAAVAAQARGFKEWLNIGAYGVDPDDKGKGLQLEFTVEDEGVFTMPWKGIITYRKALRDYWEERICAENITHYEGHRYYSDPNAKVPMADKPDF